MLVLIVIISIISGIALPVFCGCAGHYYDEDEKIGTSFCLVGADIAAGFVIGGVFTFTTKGFGLGLAADWLINCGIGALIIPVSILLTAGIIAAVYYGIKALVAFIHLMASFADRHSAPKVIFSDDYDEADYMDDYFGY